MQSDVLQPTYVQRLNESMKTDRKIEIATSTDLSGKNITTQNDVNTWTFAYNDISDVALGLSDHFVWDASSVIVDPKTKRRASIQAAYNDTAKDFHRMIEIGQSSLELFVDNMAGRSLSFSKDDCLPGLCRDGISHDGK